MPFTPPPDFDNPEGWAYFVGKYVIVEPISKHYALDTKYGQQDAWDCVVWELSPANNELIPHPGIRIFNPKLIGSLDLASRTNNPLAGHVHKGGRNGNATVIVSDGSPTMDLLEKLWTAES